MIEVRQRYLLLKAFWEGEVSRADIMEKFNISSAQATVDFRETKNKFQHALNYQASSRRYEPDDGINKYVNQDSFNEYYELAYDNKETAINIQPHARVINNLIYKSIYFAIKNNSAIKAIYQSLRQPDNNVIRTLFPHSIINSGYRWHIRAYDLKDKKFKDFNLSRFTYIKNEDDIKAPTGSRKEDDVIANKDITLILTPNLSFEEAQRNVIANDYMTNGEMSIPLVIKASVLMYVLHIYEIRNFTDSPPKTQLLQIGNFDSIQPYLQMNNAS